MFYIEVENMSSLS